MSSNRDLHAIGAVYLSGLCDGWCTSQVEKRKLKLVVVGIPKTIDNDIQLLDKTFGFDTAVEEAQRAINAAYVEVTRNRARICCFSVCRTREDKVNKWTVFDGFWVSAPFMGFSESDFRQAVLLMELELWNWWGGKVDISQCMQQSQVDNVMLYWSRRYFLNTGNRSATARAVYFICRFQRDSYKEASIWWV